MNYIDDLLALADVAVRQFNEAPAMVSLRSGKLRVDHYAETLRQFYHYTKENPAIQTLAATRFRGQQRKILKRYFQHATSEIGHDQLALNDLGQLGCDVNRVRYENPLPTTLSLNTFPIYQITYRNTVGYMGCLLFLEWMPTHGGGEYLQMLSAMGVPRQAMTFLADHVRIDVIHNDLMKDYLDELVRTEDDFQSVKFCLFAMAHYYAEMLYGAIRQVENRVDWGMCYEELAFANNDLGDHRRPLAI